MCYVTDKDRGPGAHLVLGKGTPAPPLDLLVADTPSGLLMHLLWYDLVMHVDSYIKH